MPMNASGCTAAAAILLTLSGTATADSGCRDETFRNAGYTVCSFDLAADELRIFWRNPDGAPFRTFAALADHLDTNGRELVFAMNGGMYQDNFSPIGLLTIAGKDLKSANTVDIEGEVVPNFYKKPNGVFFIGSGKAGVLETGKFLAARPPAEFATQSGPMLVIDGAIHPAFIPGSPYLNQRNGVCAPTPDKVHFAISNGVVNFDDFARFFRDKLGCDNALYLDGGSAPGIYAPDRDRDDLPGHGGYGPIIAVVK